jgi:hypothetical protein
LLAGRAHTSSDCCVLESLVLTADGAGHLQDGELAQHRVEFEAGQDRPAEGQPGAEERGSLADHSEYVQVG